MIWKVMEVNILYLEGIKKQIRICKEKKIFYWMNVIVASPSGGIWSVSHISFTFGGF